MSGPTPAAARAQKANLQKEIGRYARAAKQKKGIEGLSPGDTKSVLSQLKGRMKRVEKAIERGKQAKKTYGRSARRGGR